TRSRSCRILKRQCVLLPLKKHERVSLESAMDFQVPELGEGLYEAELTAWHVKPGDVVKRGQLLMEVMTDKATMEVPSRFAGHISELRAQPGQQIKVGQVVLTYEEDKETRRQGDKETEADGQPQRRDESKVVQATPIRASQLVAIKAAPSVR